MMTNNELQALHDENIRLECLRQSLSLTADFELDNDLVLRRAKQYERFVKTGETE